MKQILDIDSLAKRYGPIQAVDHISFGVDAGSIYGLLGPNGSGKTTLLGMVLGVLRPDRGTYSWFGNPPSHQSRKRIGALLECPNFFPYLTGYENLKITATIKSIPHGYIEHALGLVGLADRQHDKVAAYSLGMKQRLALAAAWLGKPEVLVLDEPTNGLDAQGIVEVRELILKFAAEGSTILLASHLLAEVEKLCTHVAIMKNGKLIVANEKEKVLSQTEFVTVASADMEKLKMALMAFEGVKNLVQENDSYVVELQNGSSHLDLSTYLFAQGFVLSHFAPRSISLENQYLELIAKAP